MNLKMKHKGFTVLEFLVVVAIMAILVGLILVGLNAARANSRDQQKIANLQKVAIGIQQYHDICREYPADLEPDEDCSDLQGGNLASFVPDIADYNFNTGGDYNYAPIASDDTDLDTCSNFHLWVRLEKDRDTSAAHFNSEDTNQCMSTNPSVIDATTDLTIYDIHK